MKKQKHYVLAVFIILVLLVLATKGAIDYFQNEPSYREACALMADDEYRDAQDILQEMRNDDYKSTKALIQICKAHIVYEDGDVGSAWAKMELLNELFDTSHLTREQESSVSYFKAVLNAEVDEYTAREREQEAIREEQEEASKARQGVPYIGMAEKYINDTILGRPSSQVRHNNECVGGKQYRANIYDFMDGDLVIFSARCVRGEVTEVWDNRDTAYLQSIYRPLMSNDSKKDSDDPYDVDNYDDPEDFYEENFDDFFGYEDAEDYYYAHHSK